jgi:hypothetical protein
VIQNVAPHDFTNSLSPAMAKYVSVGSVLFAAQGKSARSPLNDDSVILWVNVPYALQTLQNFGKFYIALRDHQKFGVAGNPES